MLIKNILSLGMTSLVGAVVPTTTIINTTNISQIINDENTSTQNDGSSIVDDFMDFSTKNIDEAIKIEKLVNADLDVIKSVRLDEPRAVDYHLNENNKNSLGWCETFEWFKYSSLLNGNFNKPELKENNTIHFSTKDRNKNCKNKNFNFIVQPVEILYTVPAYTACAEANLIFKNNFTTNCTIASFDPDRMFLSFQLFESQGEIDNKLFWTNYALTNETNPECYDHKTVEISANSYVESSNQENGYSKSFDLHAKFNVDNNTDQPKTDFRKFFISMMISDEDLDSHSGDVFLDSKVEVKLDALNLSKAEKEIEISNRMLDAGSKDMVSDENFTKPKLAKIYKTQKPILDKIKEQYPDKSNDLKIFASDSEFADYYFDHRDEYTKIIENSTQQQKQFINDQREKNSSGWQKYSFDINGDVGTKVLKSRENEPTINFDKLVNSNGPEKSKGLAGQFNEEGNFFELKDDDFGYDSRIIYIPIKMKVIAPANIRSFSNTLTGWKININQTSDINDINTCGPDMAYSVQVFDFGENSNATPKFLNFPADASRNVSNESDENCSYLKFVQQSECHQKDGNMLWDAEYDPLEKTQHPQKQFIFDCDNKGNNENAEKYKYFGIAICCDQHVDNCKPWRFSASFQPINIDNNAVIENVESKGLSTYDMAFNDKDKIMLNEMGQSLADGEFALEGKEMCNKFTGTESNEKFRSLYSRSRMSVTLPAKSKATYNLNFASKIDIRRGWFPTWFDFNLANSVSLFDLGDQTAPNPEFIPTSHYNFETNKEEAKISKMVSNKNRNFVVWGDSCSNITLLALAIVLISITISTGIFGIGGELSGPLILAFSIVLFVDVAPAAVLIAAGIQKSKWNKTMDFYTNESNMDECNVAYKNLFNKQIEFVNDTDENKTFTYDYAVGFTHGAQRKAERGTTPIFMTKVEPCLLDLSSI